MYRARRFFVLRRIGKCPATRVRAKACGVLYLRFHNTGHVYRYFEFTAADTSTAVARNPHAVDALNEGAQWRFAIVYWVGNRLCSFFN